MLLLATLTLAHAAEPAEPTAPPVVIEGASLASGDVRITLAAPPRAAVRVGDILTVLTADGTVEEWSIAGTPARTGVRAAPGAVGLFVVGGRAWVEVRETRAMQVEALAPAAVAVSAAPTSAAPVAPSGPRTRGGKVSLATAGVAVVSGAGLDVGNPVRFLRTEEMEVPAAGGGVEKRMAEHEVASGVVRQVDGNSAVVDVSRGGRVRAEDRVEQRAVPKDVNWAPQRFDGFREVGGVVRPTLALGTLGAAIVADAWITAGFEGPWYLSGRLSPVGLGASRDGGVSTVGALASGGYDARYLSVGLGAGWTMLTDAPGIPTYAEVDVDAPGAALSFVQEARLGARDGLHVEVRNTLVLVEGFTVTEDYSGVEPVYTATSAGTAFEFGGFALEGWVPTGDRTDVIGAVATGANGVFTIEAGVHSWMRGNGDTGSVGLRVAAGYAAVQGRGTETLAGPMVSIGARYRY